MRGAQQGISLVCWQILFLNPSVRVLNPHLVSVWETPASLPPFRLHSPRRPVKIFHVWCGLRATNHQGGSVWNLCAFLGSFGSGRVIVRVRGRVCSSGYVCDLAHSHALIWHWCTHSIGGGGGVGGYAFKRNAQKWDEPPGHRGNPLGWVAPKKRKTLDSRQRRQQPNRAGEPLAFHNFPFIFHLSSLSYFSVRFFGVRGSVPPELCKYFYKIILRLIGTWNGTGNHLWHFAFFLLAVLLIFDFGFSNFVGDKMMWKWESILNCKRGNLCSFKVMNYGGSFIDFLEQFRESYENINSKILRNFEPLKLKNTL